MRADEITSRSCSASSRLPLSFGRLLFRSRASAVENNCFRRIVLRDRSSYRGFSLSERIRGKRGGGKDVCGREREDGGLCGLYVERALYDVYLNAPPTGESHRRDAHWRFLISRRETLRYTVAKISRALFAHSLRENFLSIV